MNQDLYPLVPIVHVSETPVSSKPGVLGHGEGLKFGTAAYSKRPAIYFYRFAGKKIPTDRVAYVTCEDGYFSRQVGEKSQLILAYDPDVSAFRVLAHVGPGENTFKEKLKVFQQFPDNRTAIMHAQQCAEQDSREREKASAQMTALLASGVSLF